MKSYTTTVAEKTEGDKTDDFVEFPIDGRNVKAYRPSDEHIAIFTAKSGRRASSAEIAAAALDFFYDVLDNSSARHIEARLLDRDDPFGIEKVVEILYDLIEEWSGRPIAR